MQGLKPFVAPLKKNPKQAPTIEDECRAVIVAAKPKQPTIEDERHAVIVAARKDGEFTAGILGFYL